MAQRSIGQEQFGFARRERSASSLDSLVSLIDWSSVGVLLDPLYSLPRVSRPGRHWRCLTRCCYRSGTICPM